MTSSSYPARKTGISFAIVGLLFGLPFAGIVVFVLLLPSDHVAGNAAVSILLALVPAALSAACAVFFVRLSPSKTPGLAQGVMTTLLAYLLFFVFLGVLGSDIGGVIATGLHLLTIAPILWLFPIVGGITGMILKKKSGAD